MNDITIWSTWRPKRYFEATLSSSADEEIFGVVEVRPDQKWKVSCITTGFVRIKRDGMFIELPAGCLIRLFKEEKGNERDKI